VILFLDIDGVLNDHRKWASKYSPILFENVVHLNTILGRVPEVRIVLSSAWRYVFNTVPTIETLLMCHGCDCCGRVLGATCSDEEINAGPMPAFDDPERWRSLGLTWRADQIERFVEQHNPEEFVVLDDLPLQVPNLVQTLPNVGLTAADAITAISILQAAPSTGGTP
jgi:hypothetical protein